MNVKNYSAFINESTDDLGFSTEIKSKNVDFENDEKIVDKKLEQYAEPGNLIVLWNINMDSRKSGINSFEPVITGIKGCYTVVTPSQEGKDTEDEVEFDARMGDWEFEPILSSSFSFGDGIYPDSVKIDFDAKKIIVSF